MALYSIKIKNTITRELRVVNPNLSSHVIHKTILTKLSLVIIINSVLFKIHLSRRDEGFGPMTLYQPDSIVSLVLPAETAKK